MSKQDITNVKAAEVDVATRSLLDRELFDASFFGTGIRSSVVLYILTAITLLSFFILPFTNNTITTRSQNNKEIGNYKSEVSDMVWNEKPSTGFQIALGRTVHYTRVDRKDSTIRIPLTNGTITGKNTKDMNLYISYGNILIALVPILAIYVAIMVASREQWQKGKGFLVAALISFFSLAFNFVVIRKLATSYTDSAANSVISKRISDIFGNLGIGFYVTVICLILIIVFSFQAYFKLRKGDGFVSKKNKELYDATVNA